MCQYSAENGAANDWHLQHLGSLSLWAPGLSSSSTAPTDAGTQLNSDPTRRDDGPQPVADLGRAANRRRRKAGWGCTASLRTHPRRFRAHRDAPPHPCASRAAELGPALRRPAPLTCSSLPQSRAAQAVRMRDVSATTPAEPRQPARIGPARAPNGALPRPAGDAHTGRSKPQSQGGSQPPSQQWSGVRRSSQPGHRGGAPL